MGDEDLAGRHQFLLGLDQQHLAGAGFGRTVEDTENRRAGQLHRFSHRAGAEVVREEQSGDGVARTIHDDRQQ